MWTHSFPLYRYCIVYVGSLEDIGELDLVLLADNISEFGDQSA